MHIIALSRDWLRHHDVYLSHWQIHAQSSTYLLADVNSSAQLQWCRPDRVADGMSLYNLECKGD